VATSTIDLGPELTTLLSQSQQPLEDVVREMVVLELYRRAEISSGRAAELLGMDRTCFMYYFSRLGIPFFRMSDDQWEREARYIESL